jgi:2-oxoisovalerate dehydrogenase E1 component alpha subunit
MPRSVELAPARRSAARGNEARQCVARFEVHCTRFLDADGRPVAELPEIARDARALVPLYRAMLLTRQFDQRAVALQRTGRLGTYPSSYGQEAAEVAIGAAMAREDVLLGTYRETGAMLVRGVEMHEILAYWGGDERGMAYSGPEAPREDFPISVPIATHAPHAVGVAYAFKLRNERRVAVCVLGDGGTSKGDFYEALNAAGVWQLPLLFVVVNNQWAISVPRETQSRAPTLAQKAIAAGIEGEQVDGNDAIAMYHVSSEALARCRSGGGPRLIEALTYRLSDHTTADDARRYRSELEVERARALDPVPRLRKYLEREGVWGDADEEELVAEHARLIDAAVDRYLETPPPAPGAMFEHLFETLPAALEPQRESVEAEEEGETP